MLDAAARKLIDPTMNRLGRSIARRGIGADQVTLAGAALGVAAAGMIAAGLPGLALVPLLVSRLADGLDGAVARVTGKTDFGGYLDITADFLFYGLIPLAFVLADPASNGAAGAFLLGAFYFNGASFLGFAILAEKARMQTARQGVKSLYFSDGLLEGTETIALFVLICVFPGAFSALAWGFGALCYLSGALRIADARKVFRG